LKVEEGFGLEGGRAALQGRVRQQNSKGL